MIERVLELWNNGFSEYEIAKKFDVPYNIDFSTRTLKTKYIEENKNEQ